jgi:CheY-like chemotaxis protein
MKKVNKILIIDDDLIFLRIAGFQLQKKLEEQVVEVHTAATLGEIEEKMENIYDMIFIDLNMPEISGWEVIERYKESLKSPNCTAFICSSSIDPKDHKRAEDMKDIIEKMISKPIDIDLVKSYLNS